MSIPQDRNADRNYFGIPQSIENIDTYAMFFSLAQYQEQSLKNLFQTQQEKIDSALEYATVQAIKHAGIDWSGTPQEFALKNGEIRMIEDARDKTKPLISCYYLVLGNQKIHILSHWTEFDQVEQKVKTSILKHYPEKCSHPQTFTK